MKLTLTRSQRSGGMLGGKIVFKLNARVSLNEQEQHAIKTYKLGGTVIYNSEASRKHLENVSASAHSDTAGGIIKAYASLAMAKLSLNITIDSLTKGQEVECKDLDELLGADEAIKEACAHLRTYLDTAATFDGREEVIEF